MTGRDSLPPRVLRVLEGKDEPSRIHLLSHVRQGSKSSISLPRVCIPGREPNFATSFILLLRLMSPPPDLELGVGASGLDLEDRTSVKL